MPAVVKKAAMQFRLPGKHLRGKYRGALQIVYSVGTGIIGGQNFARLFRGQRVVRNYQHQAQRLRHGAGVAQYAATGFNRHGEAAVPCGSHVIRMAFAPGGEGNNLFVEKSTISKMETRGKRAYNRRGAGAHSGTHGNLIPDFKFETALLSPTTQRLAYGSSDQIIRTFAHAIGIDPVVIHHNLAVGARRHTKVEVKAEGDGATIKEA